MSDPALDRLTRILVRAKHRAALLASTRTKAKKKSKDREVAEDYADRLAEKARFRELLEDVRLDGLRFRWYFKGANLAELREMIDNEIAKETERAKNVAQADRQVVPNERPARPDPR